MAIYNSPVDTNADGRIMYIQYFSRAILLVVAKYGVLLLKDAIHLMRIQFFFGLHFVADVMKFRAFRCLLMHH